MNGRCAFAVQFIVIRMKIETAQPAVQCCADVHFFFVIRTGVSLRYKQKINGQKNKNISEGKAKVANKDKAKGLTNETEIAGPSSFLDESSQQKKRAKNTAYET
jgi:hypothetical protein